MRVFVTISIAVALVMIGYGVISSRGDDSVPGESGDTGVESTGVENPVPTMPVDAQASSNPPANTGEAFPDDDHCFQGDSTADSAVADRLVILDPGHGGEDLGTVNTEFDITESELVLPISEKLRDRLVASGAHVCMTRIDDSYLGLIERADFANERDGDVFISMHLNSLPDPDDNYTMTMWGNEAKDRFLAETLIDPLRFEMAEPESLNGNPNPMSPEVYRVEDLDSNMLKTVEMPAVLVEASFLSSTWETQAFLAGIEDGTHWREHQIADSVHDGLITFFEAFQ